MTLLIAAVSGSGIVARLAAFTEPWKTLFADSKPVADAVLFVHLGGIVVAAGFALATDRATFRVLKDGSESDRNRHLRELHAVHRPVLGALALVVASGVMLFASDVETFAPSVVFWTKMTLVTLLLINGAVLAKSETALRQTLDASTPVPAESTAPLRLWGRLRLTAGVSGVLWLAIVLAGVIVANI